MFSNDSDYNVYVAASLKKFITVFISTFIVVCTLHLNISVFFRFSSR